MNEQTTKLIEQLAQKLGTTTEYLWGVLLKQAPITATLYILFFVIMCVTGVVLFKMYRRFRKEDEYDTSVGLEFATIFGVIGWIIAFTLSVCLLGDAITAIFNPEYWALKEILSVIN